MYKILHILTDSNFGGAGRYLINYLRSHDRSRFQICVVLPRGSLLVSEVAPLNVAMIEADGIADQSFSADAIRTLRRIIRTQQPDLVHTHGSLSGRIAARLCGKRVIFTRHCAFNVPSYLKKGPGHWLNGVVNHLLADHIIAISPAAAENLTDAGINRDKITVMMNGCEPLKRSSEAEIAALKARFGIGPNVFTAGILARLEPYKGHSVMLDAAKELMEEGREFRFLIAGSGSEEAAIRRRIQELGLENHVQLLGFVSDVAPLLSILDIQLNCSVESETSSLSIIEGMSMGLPTAASNCSGNPWLIEDGVSGVLFENGSAQDLAHRLRMLMDDPQKLEHLRQEAQKAYRSRYTGEIFARNTEAVYMRILNTK